MEISLCKQLQKICLSERLLQLSYDDPGLKLLDSIKKCNIIFHIAQPRFSEYIQNLVIETNETGVGVNYNMYDFGSFEKLLEALKYKTEEKILKLPSLSKKIYSNLMSSLCTYISIMTNTNRVINFLEHIKPFGVFCLDKDVLVNLQPLDRIESTILVNGQVNIHDNIPLVLPLEKIINLYNLDKFSSPIPLFMIVGPSQGIFGENLERYSHHITNTYDFQHSIETTKEILNRYSNNFLTELTIKICPNNIVHLPYGIGFYIGTPQMTSYGALMECQKQILAYQDFPIISYLTYTVGAILLGYIYPEGMTFQYNQIKQDDGTFSLYFNSYAYTCHQEWTWKSFTKKQLVSDENSVFSTSNIDNSISFSDMFFQNLNKTITQDIQHLEQNLERYEETDIRNQNLERYEETDIRNQIEFLQKQKQEMMESKDTRIKNKEDLNKIKLELQTTMINLLDQLVTSIPNNEDNNLNSIIDELNITIKKFHNNEYKIMSSGYCFNPGSAWHENPTNIKLFESIIKKINNIDQEILLKYKEKLIKVLQEINIVIEGLPLSFYEMYNILNPPHFDSDSDSDILDKKGGEEEEEEGEKKEEEEEGEDDKKSITKTISPVKINQEDKLIDSPETISDDIQHMVKNIISTAENESQEQENIKNESKKLPGQEDTSLEAKDTSLESNEQNLKDKIDPSLESNKQHLPMTFSSEMKTLKSKPREKKKNTVSKRPKLVDVQSIKSNF
jgi:hypothetical protein